MSFLRVFPITLLWMLLFTGMGIALAYWFLRRDLGPQRASDTLNRRLPFMVGFVIIALVAVFGLEYVAESYGVTSHPVLLLLISIVLWGSIIWAVWQRQNDGRVLVDIGPPTQREYTVSAVMMGFPVVGLLLGSLLAPNDGLILALFASSIPMFLSSLLQRLVSVRFTTAGISPFGGFIKWAAIKAYEWVGEEQQPVLILQVGKLGGKIHWRIPPQQRPAVEQVLAQYLPHLSPPVSIPNP